MAKTYLNAEAVAAEEAGDVRAWMRAARKFTFYQRHHLPAEIVVSKEWYERLVKVYAQQPHSLGGELHQQDDPRGQLLFRRIPLVPEAE